MQPENDNPENWQQPTQQPVNSPYSAVDEPEPTPVQPAVAPEAPQPIAPVPQPVVTMQPDLTATSPAADPVQPAVAGTTEPEDNDTADAEPVRWQAMEYIHHEKNSLWFIGFAAVTILLMAMAIFLMKSWTFAVLIPVMAAALLVYAQRPPRVLNYALGRKGLHINDRLYPFSDFKAFAVVKGDVEHSISLIPLKRFSPAVSVYFPESAGESIVDLLAARMPMQELHLDFIDQITRKLRL